MSWINEESASCSGDNHLRFREIAAAMPSSAIDVTISANQVSPFTNGRSWSGTFSNQTCVRDWLLIIAAQDIFTYNTWDGVCQAMYNQGISDNFICKYNGAGQSQIANLPTGANSEDYMNLYMFDRTGPWCNWAGINNRPGFNILPMEMTWGTLETTTLFGGNFPG